MCMPRESHHNDGAQQIELINYFGLSVKLCEAHLCLL